MRLGCSPHGVEIQPKPARIDAPLVKSRQLWDGNDVAQSASSTYFRLLIACDGERPICPRRPRPTVTIAVVCRVFLITRGGDAHHAQ